MGSIWKKYERTVGEILKKNGEFRRACFLSNSTLAPTFSNMSPDFLQYISHIYSYILVKIDAGDEEKEKKEKRPYYFLRIKFTRHLKGKRWISLTDSKIRIITCSFGLSVGLDFLSVRGPHCNVACLTICLATFQQMFRDIHTSRTSYYTLAVC